MGAVRSPQKKKGEIMSDLWKYTPEKCDGDFCPMDCDTCPKEDSESDDDLQCNTCNHKYKCQSDEEC